MGRRSTLDRLAEVRDKRQLVSLERAAIDPNSISGFVIDFSDKLILLQYEYDFHIDGLLILRIKDITDIRVSKTQEFQQQLLHDENQLEKIDFDTRINLKNWATALPDLMEKHTFLILEYESLSNEHADFFIGTPLRSMSRNLSLRYFTGAGRWLDEPVTVEFKKLTCCQVGTNYINVYQRHFERQYLAAQSAPKGIAL